MNEKILVVEDDDALVLLLRRKLEADGYTVLSARNGVEGLNMVQNHQPDLILLDLMMPRMNGWEACRRIRELSDTPIIVLTAIGGDTNTARTLDLGADDYLTKPFSLVELSARIRAALRRRNHPIAEDTPVQIDSRLIFDRPHRCVIVDGQSLELSAVEYRLLNCFLDNAGRILTHQSLLTQVWGWEYTDQKDYVKVYVHHLRQKIEQDPSNPEYILTERGLGYRFQMPEAR